MSDELIRVHAGHVTRLTLNRPHKANALSAALVEALLDAVDYAAGDGTRLLVLDAAGDHFCAGFDFGGYHEQGDGELALRFIRIELLLQAVHHAPFETLAFAHGRNFGAGADLVACAGVRIASPGTTFRMPGLRFGVVLGTRRLAGRIGADRARAVLSAAATFDAAEALATGFLTGVAERAQWPEIERKTLAACESIAPAAAAALHRRTVHDTRAEDLAELARSVSAPGLKERIRLFRETKP